MNVPRRPRRPQMCSKCTMFGHRSSTCHLNFAGYGGDNDIRRDFQRMAPLHRYAMNKWRRHEARNRAWIAAGGAGHTVPAPQPPQPPKTPFEQACDNTCKVTHSDDCCICMEALGEKNTAITACGHQFHFGCLAQHTSRSDKCPMCRGIVRPELPKRDLKLPSDRDILNLAIRASVHLSDILGEMIGIDDNQQHMLSDALAHVMTDMNRQVLREIRGHNQ